MRRLILAIAIGAAYVLTITSVYTSCRFWEATSEAGSTSAAGLFSFSYRHETCISLRSVRKSEWGEFVGLSASTKFAQTMGVFASILGGIACLLTITGSCLMSFFTVTKRRWRSLLAGSILGAGVCQSLTFVLLVQIWDEEDCNSEDSTCALGFGGLCSIGATVLYFFAGTVVTAVACQPPKENPGTTFLARTGVRLMHKMGISWKQKQFSTFRWQDFVLLGYSLLLALFSMQVFFDCRFFVVNFQNNTREYEEGLLRYYYYPDNKCIKFEQGSKVSFTAQSKAGIAFAGIAFSLGAILLWLLFTMVLVFFYPPVVYKILPGIAALAAVCQSLVFLSVSERNDILCAEEIPDQTCELGADAYVAMINTLLFLVAAPGLRWYINNTNTNGNVAEDIQDDDDDPSIKKEAGLTTDLPPPEIDEGGDYPDYVAKNEGPLQVDTTSLMTGDATKMD